MTSPESTNTNWKQRNNLNTKRLAKWTAAWVISLALATFGDKFIWQQNELITAIAIGINFLVGIMMIMVNKQHLIDLDELQQKIQLNAMGLSLGIGLIVGISYSTLDTTGLISSHAEISHLIIVMALTYMIGIILGNRKYQ
ncbi:MULTISPECIES: hypothetical protein [Pseudomonadati]|jgi:hypothetical protein|uniref:Uncharacterized protein n=1 Tax=Shewanella aestuarii TaxID=1028752 RepID=A0ABT0KYI0_9GAMM|nr:hypothetical protein [Shewanella aestuarii]MCL1116528.1 hypothetical protein [Shewanella aestuarii]GGN71959.1 hypothetical protein GCM10009193_08340 [Shewanella aestuarii]